MARLRKSYANEPNFFIPPNESRVATRTSPRKMTRESHYVDSSDEESHILVPKSSRRDIRYTLENNEDSFFVPKMPTIPTDVLTPRKQRVLRPVQSNSRLLSRLNDQALSTPEKRMPRERRVRSGTTEIDVGRRGKLMYAKSLAKSVAKKQVGKNKIDVVEIVEIEQSEARPEQESIESIEDAMVVDEVEQIETSICCGDVETASSEEEDVQSSESSDEDEDVVNPGQRRRKPQPRRIVLDSDSDESELVMETREDDLRRFSPTIPEPRLDYFARNRVYNMSSSPKRSSPVRSHGPAFNCSQDTNALTSPEPPNASETHTFRSAPLASSRPSTAQSANANAVLTYSPTPKKFRSPQKIAPNSHHSIPPLAPPSPSKLVSPSKQKPAIPKAEHFDGRPSLDAFWDPEVVNEWTDKYAPSQIPVSPRKQKWRDDMIKMMEGMGLEDGSDSEHAPPPSSPRKRITKLSSRSPMKKCTHELSEAANTKALRAERKDFEISKHSIATFFIVELDQTLCSGRIAQMCEPTGGIKIDWSKTLKTTAGRATWRREIIRDPAKPTITKHHCTITLATKIITEPERLHNVLAHEFCHLATFMISGVSNNPHGKEFKSWGKKASSAFAHMDVEVTTKHDYAIEYRFVWECVTCGREVKRHSRSLDTKAWKCGCGGQLVQTKPVPRRGKAYGAAGSADADSIKGTSAKPREKSEYQLFVKEHFARIKKEIMDKGESGQMGKVMEVVAREYRAMKAEKKSKREEREALLVVDEVELALALGELEI